MEKKGRDSDIKAKLDDEEIEKTYEFKEILGRGAFGVVSRAEKDGAEYAVKTLKCVRLQQRKDAEREIAILQQLDDERICRLKSAARSGRNIFMIMELCTGGELFEKIAGDSEVPAESSVISYTRQICEALQYLHSKNVIHLDIKPENVVMASSESDQVKLIDFGGAQFYTKGKVVRTMFGTREYMAPETLGYDPVEFQTDMWSTGVMCYNLLSGLSPFLGDDDAETECNIQTCNWDFDCLEFDHVTPAAKNFIEKLLLKKPAERMSATECLAHEWLSHESQAAAARENRSLSITLIGNLKALIARRRWNRAGTALKAIGRINSSIKLASHNDVIPESKEKPLAEHDSQSNFEIEITTEKPTKIDSAVLETKTESTKICENHVFETSEDQKPLVKSPNPNENSNNNTDFLSKLQFEISDSMKFRPPEVTEPLFSSSSHSKRTISQESTDSGESGISTDQSHSESTHSQFQAKVTSRIESLKAKFVEKNLDKRKDSGLSSEGEEDHIIIIRRSRKRIPQVVKD